MFCEKCGNKLNEGDLFCEKCGNRVAIDEGNIVLKHKKNKKLIISIITLIILIVVTIDVMKTDEKKYSTNTSESSIEKEEIVDKKESVETKTEESAENITVETKKTGAIKVGNVEQLYDSDEYNHKKIEITGMVNYESPADGIFKMYGAYSEVEAYLFGSSGYNIPANDCLMVIGVVEKDEYGMVCINVEYAEELGEPL